MKNNENPQIVTCYNYDPDCNLGERNTKPSITVPDQSLTVEEIIDLYARGIGIDNIYHHGEGLDDPDFDDIDPTTNPSFDIIEAKKILDDINSKGVPPEVTTEGTSQNNAQSEGGEPTDQVK